MSIRKPAYIASLALAGSLLLVGCDGDPTVNAQSDETPSASPSAGGASSAPSAGSGQSSATGGGSGNTSTSGVSNGSGGKGSAGSGKEATAPCSNPDFKLTLTVQAGEGEAGVATVQAKNTGSTVCYLPEPLDLQLWERGKELPVDLEQDAGYERLKIAPSRSVTAHLTYTLPKKGEEVGSLVNAAQFEFHDVGKVAADLKNGIGLEGMVVMGSAFHLSEFELD
ncbi:hypothetical protein ACWCQZ_51190 [Streptomyces sp. NPDC002285]